MLCRTSILAAVLCLAAAAHAAEPPAITLFENVRVFDGKSEQLSANVNVLVRGNTIEKISKDPIAIDAGSSATTIAGGGRTLMPGLIDAHWHAMLVRPTPAELLVGCRLPEPGGSRRGDGHADARVHHRARRGRAVVRPQARHRRGHRRRPAHLSVRRHHHRHQRSRRLSPRARAAARPRRAPVAPGADGSGDGRRQPG